MLAGELALGILGLAANDDGVNLGHVDVKAVVVKIEITPFEAHGRGHHRPAELDVAVFLNADNGAVRLHVHRGRVVGEVEALHAAHQQLVGVQVEGGVAARARERLDGDVVVVFAVAGGGHVVRALGQNGHVAGLGVPGHVAVAGQPGHVGAHVGHRRFQVSGQVAHIHSFHVFVRLGVAHQHLERVQPVDAFELLVAVVGEELLALKIGRLLVFRRQHREVDGGLAQVPGQGFGPDFKLVVRVAVRRVFVQPFLPRKLELLLGLRVFELRAGVRHRVFGPLVNGDGRPVGGNERVAEHVGPR